MTAEELIKKLKRLPPNTEIAYPGEFGDVPIDVLLFAGKHAIVGKKVDLVGKKRSKLIDLDDPEHQGAIAREEERMLEGTIVFGYRDAPVVVIGPNATKATQMAGSFAITKEGLMVSTGKGWTMFLKWMFENIDHQNTHS